MKLITKATNHGYRIFLFRVRTLYVHKGNKVFDELLPDLDDLVRRNN